jgi:hypothetical protein
MIFALALASASGPTWAQDASSEHAPYCAELKQVTALAMTREKFAPIAGKLRDGNFLDTSLALTGWEDCALYGLGTYTCDYRGFETTQEAEQAQARTLHEIKACLGEAWAEAKDRSSASYVVLHHAGRPVSITLSTDETDKKHVVRLVLFVRRN